MQYKKTAVLIGTTLAVALVVGAFMWLLSGSKYESRTVTAAEQGSASTPASAPAPTTAPASAPTLESANADWSTVMLAEKMASGAVFRLIDVRESYEYAAGHIQGSELVPLNSLSANLSRFNRTEEIAVICRSGNRSSQAVSILRKAGFERVHNVVGGMNAWKGLEVKAE